jgi:hypothetical protein
LSCKLDLLCDGLQSGELAGIAVGATVILNVLLGGYVYKSIIHHISHTLGNPIECT